jgi:hypothetical protein
MEGVVAQEFLRVGEFGDSFARSLRLRGLEVLLGLLSRVKSGMAFHVSLA